MMILSLFSKTVAATFYLITAMEYAWAIPRPGVMRERHIIHAPIKFTVIHHFKIKKIPVVIQRHLHYHKLHEEIHTNEVHHDENERNGYSGYEYHQKDEHPKFKTSDVSFHQDEEKEDDYEGAEDSEEEEYNGYE